MEKKKIILDVDTGSDDAIALITALKSDELEVIGVTTVNGNRPVDNTTENTLRVIDLLGLGEKVPVYRGCETPMVAELLKTRGLKQTVNTVEKDGKTITYHHQYLDEFQPSKTKVQNDSAVTWLVNTLNNTKEKITIVAVGPLTNIGVALRADPRIKNNIEKIIIMGGGCRQTNTTSAAEFNIHKDPEAAQIVLTSGCDILLIPLDATHRAWVTKKESNEFRNFGSEESIAVANLLDSRIEAYDAMQPINVAPLGSTPPHDALAVCAAIDENVLKDIELCRVDIDFGGGLADGMTIVDPRVKTDDEKNVRMAFGANRELFIKMLKERICK